MTEERFDAFISYSRAASAPLALALHGAVERFAKPWYRLRASRIFRDDSSMSANTALWSTIEKGLSESGWLVLLATPESAASQYVADEVRWWLEHKSAETILLVQASGDLFWDRAAGRFDAARSTALPAGLVGAYAEEPRWIDMRWFAAEGSLGKADPRFVEAVADLTAAIRGLDRDKLIGENVRQHRRVRRLTQAAVTALSILLLASIGAGVIAVAQAAEASTQRDVAQDEARVATARQLAATSQSLIGSDLVIARLLADQAFRLHDDASTRAALLQSVSVDPTFLESISVGSAITAFAPTADGSVVAIGTAAGDVLVWRRDGGELTTLGSLSMPVTEVAIDDSGSVVAASAAGGFTDDGSSIPIPSEVVVWNDGDALVLPDGASDPIAVSPSGDTVAFRVSSGSGADPASDTVGTLETVSGVSSVANAPTGYFLSVHLADDDSVIIENGAGLGSLEYIRYTLPALSNPEPGYGGPFVLRRPVQATSVNGQWAVVVDPEGLLEIRDVFGAARDDTPFRAAEIGAGSVEALAVSRDGTRVAYADTGVISVLEPAGPVYLSPDPILVSGVGDVSDLAFTDDGLLFAVEGDRVAVLDPTLSSPLVRSYPTFARWLSNAGPAPTVEVNETGEAAIVTEEDGSSTWHVFADGTSAQNPAWFLDWKDASSAYFLDPNGSLLLSGEGFQTTETVGWVLPPNDPDSFAFFDVADARYLPESGELVIATIDRLLTMDLASGEVVSHEEITVEAISPDARVVVARDGDAVSVTDRSSGATLSSFDAPPPISIRFAGDTLVMGGTAYALSASGAEEIVSFGESFHIPAAVDDERRIVARYLTDGTLEISSLTTGLRIGEFSFPHTATRRPGFGFAGDGSVLALVYENTDSEGEEGTMTLVDLDPASWTTVACETAGRDLTDAEWRRFVGTDPPETLRCGG